MLAKRFDYDQDMAFQKAVVTLGLAVQVKLLMLATRKARREELSRLRRRVAQLEAVAALDGDPC